MLNWQGNLIFWTANLFFVEQTNLCIFRFPDTFFYSGARQVEEVNNYAASGLYTKL